MASLARCLDLVCNCVQAAAERIRLNNLIVSSATTLQLRKACYDTPLIRTQWTASVRGVLWGPPPAQPAQTLINSGMP